MKKTLLALAAAALATVGLATVAFGAVDSLGIGSATVAPGGEVSVNVTVEATGDGVGAWNVDINYGSSGLIELTGCTSSAGICNPDFVAGETARLVGASASGLSGSVSLGTLTFTAGDEEGVADLEVVVNQLTDPTGEDLDVDADDGTITIEAATPVPTAAPTATPCVGAGCPTAVVTAAPVATATPAAVPNTGGEPGDSSLNMSAWLLAIVGLAVVSGGVWAVARTRQ